MNTEWKALSSKVLAVAVKGPQGDWAAYIDAVPGLNHEQEYIRVMQNGAKLPKEVATTIFPQWAKRYKWRR